MITGKLQSGVHGFHGQAGTRTTPSRHQAVESPLLMTNVSPDRSCPAGMSTLMRFSFTVSLPTCISCNMRSAWTRLSEICRSMRQPVPCNHLQLLVGELMDPHYSTQS